jgi:hypothetical protein
MIEVTQAQIVSAREFVAYLVAFAFAFGAITGYFLRGLVAFARRLPSIMRQAQKAQR